MQLYGSVNSEVKVTDTDPANEGTPNVGGRDCGGEPVPWPYAIPDLNAVYDDYPTLSKGVWSLNSAADTVAAMRATNQNIYIADVNGNEERLTDVDNSTTGIPQVLKCNWYSFAALNDHIAYLHWQAGLFPFSTPDPLQTPIYTGISIGVGASGLVPSRQPEQYLDWIVRARLEAEQHPDIVKVVWFDELWLLLANPENNYRHGHWDPAKVNLLHDMTKGIAPDGTAIGGIDIDFWVRMTDTESIRFVVPSSVLGVPASDQQNDPDFAWPGDGTAFISWTVDAPSPASMAERMISWVSYLEFIYIFSDFHKHNLELEVWCNGTRVGSFLVMTGSPDTTAIPIELLEPQRDVVYYARVELGSGSSAAGGRRSGAWNGFAGAANDVQFVLRRSSSSPASDKTNNDRMVWISAARVVYEKESDATVVWRSPYLDHDRAQHGLGGGLATSAHALATTNLAWRITPYIDGVGINHAIEGVVEIIPGVVEYEVTGFDRLMEFAAHCLHNAFRGPKRCLVDERGQVNDSASRDLIDTALTSERMEVAAAWADGVLVEFMPMELHNLVAQRGRYAERQVVGAVSGPGWPGADIMAYEARLTRTYLGETHEWRAVAPCSGSYRVGWKLVATSSAPDMRIFIGSVNSSGERSEPFAEQLSELRSLGTLEGTVPLVNVEAGDTIVVGWTLDPRVGLGGASLKYSNRVLFKVLPSTGGCAPRALAWTYTPRQDASYSKVQEMYDCLTTWFTDGNGSRC